MRRHFGADYSVQKNLEHLLNPNSQDIVPRE